MTCVDHGRRLRRARTRCDQVCVGSHAVLICLRLAERATVLSQMESRWMVRRPSRYSIGTISLISKACIVPADHVQGGLLKFDSQPESGRVKYWRR